jgi:hypothetical protein
MGMLLPGLSTLFGHGYCMPAIGPGAPDALLPNALTIQPFDDSVVPNTLVGALSFDGYINGDPLTPGPEWAGLPVSRVRCRSTG